MKFTCSAKRLCVMLTAKVPCLVDYGITVSNKPRYACLHRSGALYGRACGCEISPLIESGEIDVSALTHDTTKSPEEVDDAPPPDKAALIIYYQERLVCRLCWEDGMALRTSKAFAEVVEVIGEVAAVDAVVIEPTVIRSWGKRMSEGKGSQTYKAKKARSKESTPILTVEAKLAILDKTRLMHVSQKGVLEKHGVSRLTCQSWRQREKA